MVVLVDQEVVYLADLVAVGIVDRVACVPVLDGSETVALRSSMLASVVGNLYLT